MKATRPVLRGADGSNVVRLPTQLGSTRGLLDSSGNVVGSYTFTPYGEVKGHSGASTPFGYAGQYTDSESGLQYLEARYYDPSTAQFLSMDPLVAATGTPYGYTPSDPLNSSDPTGLDTVRNGPGVVGGGLSGVGAAAGWTFMQGYHQTSSTPNPAKPFASVAGQSKFGTYVGNSFKRSFHVDKHVSGWYDRPHFNVDVGAKAPQRIIDWANAEWTDPATGVVLKHPYAPQWLLTVTSTRNLKFIGGSLVAVGAGIDAVSLLTAPQCQRGATIGGIAGGYVGGFAGSILGSEIWVGPGTFAGGVIGGSVGSAAGQAIGGLFDSGCC